MVTQITLTELISELEKGKMHPLFNVTVGSQQRLYARKPVEGGYNFIIVYAVVT